jgi:hypothetical protein
VAPTAIDAIVAGVGPETSAAGPVVESDGVTVVRVEEQLLVSASLSVIFEPGYWQIEEAGSWKLAARMHEATVRVGDVAVVEVMLALARAKAVK